MNHVEAIDVLIKAGILAEVGERKRARPENTVDMKAGRLN